MSKSHDMYANLPSEQSFARVFAVFFLLVWGYFYLTKDHSIWQLPVASVVILVLGYLIPKSLTLPNKAWFHFGLLLGKIVAPIVMFGVFVIAFIPMGFIIRLLGKDLLNTKIDKSAKSYWVKRTVKPQSMKNQF